AQSRGWRMFPDADADVFAVNLSALHQAIRYAVQARAQRFLAASTGSVYSSPGPHRETDPIDLHAARSFYVATKLAGEILLGPYTRLLPIVQLRLFLPYGAGQNPTMLLPQLVQRVAEDRPITLHGTHGLTANPVAAEDVAETLLRCLRLQNSA